MWFLEHVDEVLRNVCEAVGGGSVGHVHMGREELDGVADTFSPGGGNVTRVVAIMVHCGSKVIAGDTVVGPCATFLWSLMDDNFAARWGEGSFIKVKDAPQLVVCGEFWVEA